jgi:hypothetical protein
MYMQVGAWQWKFNETKLPMPVLLPVMVWTQVPFTSAQPGTVASHFGTSYS